MADCFWTDFVGCAEECGVTPLLKPFQRVFIPAIPGHDEQMYTRRCPSQGGGSSGGSTPSPGQRCTTVLVYGPPSPIDHQPTVIGTKVICT